MKRTKGFISALVLGLSSLLPFVAASTAHAVAPYTCTWTGGGSDSILVQPQTGAAVPVQLRKLVTPTISSSITLP